MDTPQASLQRGAGLPVLAEVSGILACLHRLQLAGGTTMPAWRAQPRGGVRFKFRSDRLGKEEEGRKGCSRGEAVALSFPLGFFYLQ